jgi:hypothetical protein
MPTDPLVLVGDALHAFTDAELRTFRNLLEFTPEKLRVVNALLVASGKYDPLDLDGSPDV